MTQSRVGLDPLADNYLKLGADKHTMEYVNSPSENMPFQDRLFDITCTFNSLDHVNNIGKTISEIKRVTAKGGILLLLVEINHEPTACELHSLNPDIVHSFEPEFNCSEIQVFKPHPKGLYDSVLRGETYSDPENCKELGWLSAKFDKIS